MNAVRALIVGSMLLAPACAASYITNPWVYSRIMMWLIGNFLILACMLWSKDNG